MDSAIFPQLEPPFQQLDHQIAPRGRIFRWNEDSNELSVKLDKDGSMEILEGADSPTVYVPLGQYCIQEVTKDGSRQSEFGYEVVDSANVPDPDDRTKCTAN